MTRNLNDLTYVERLDSLIGTGEAPNSRGIYDLAKQLATQVDEIVAKLIGFWGDHPDKREARQYLAKLIDNLLTRDKAYTDERLQLAKHLGLKEYDGFCLDDLIGRIEALRGAGDGPPMNASGIGICQRIVNECNGTGGWWTASHEFQIVKSDRDALRERVVDFDKLTAEVATLRARVDGDWLDVGWLYMRSRNAWLHTFSRAGCDLSAVVKGPIDGGGPWSVSAVGLDVLGDMRMDGPDRDDLEEAKKDADTLVASLRLMVDQRCPKVKVQAEDDSPMSALLGATISDPQGLLGDPSQTHTVQMADVRKLIEDMERGPADAPPVDPSLTPQDIEPVLIGAVRDCLRADKIDEPDDDDCDECPRKAECWGRPNGGFVEVKGAPGITKDHVEFWKNMPKDTP